MSNVKTITLDEILEDLKKGECHFSFVKAGGEPRYMVATLNPDILPKAEEEANSSRLQEQKEKGTLTAVPVWEPAVQGWRSFRLASLTDWNGDSVVYAGS